MNASTALTICPSVRDWLAQFANVSLPTASSSDDRSIIVDSDRIYGGPQHGFTEDSVGFSETCGALSFGGSPPASNATKLLVKLVDIWDSAPYNTVVFIASCDGSTKFELTEPTTVVVDGTLAMAVARYREDRSDTSPCTGATAVKVDWATLDNYCRTDSSPRECANSTTGSSSPSASTARPTKTRSHTVAAAIALLVMAVTATSS